MVIRATVGEYTYVANKTGRATHTASNPMEMKEFGGEYLPGESSILYLLITRFYALFGMY